MSDDRILDRARWIPGPPTREGYYWMLQDELPIVVRFQLSDTGKWRIYRTVMLQEDNKDRPLEEYGVTHHLPIPVPEPPGEEVSRVGNRVLSDLMASYEEQARARHGTHLTEPAKWPEALDTAPVLASTGTVVLSLSDARLIGTLAMRAVEHSLGFDTEHEALARFRERYAVAETFEEGS